LVVSLDYSHAPDLLARLLCVASESATGTAMAADGELTLVLRGERFTIALNTEHPGPNQLSGNEGEGTLPKASVAVTATAVGVR
jgi:hypothetical protein